MPNHKLRKGRVIWIATGLVVFSLFMSSITGVDFVTIFKPSAALFAIGMILWWTAFELADWTPYDE